MKGIMGQALEASSADEGQPVIGILVGSISALALWGAILGVIALIV